MKNKKLFQETQSFLSNWFVAGLILILLWIFLYEAQAFSGWTSNKVIAAIVVSLSMLLLLSIRLRTVIDAEGIHIDFRPFVWNKTWKWADIEQVQVKKYSLWDYGGWGYRIAKGGLAYTTKGQYGFQVTFKNGKKILVGTQYPVQLQEILNHITNDEES